MEILQVKNLTKKFGSFTAVNDISFSLKEGEVLGLLGPNGAGKTTTLQMLLGILTPSDGSVVYFGKDLNQHRVEILEDVNFSSAYTKLPWNLSVKENLKFISYLYKIRDRTARLEKIKKIFQLEEIWNKEVRDLSAGQTTRVNLAKSLVNYPKVLLLDEPTASLDPEVASSVREFLQVQRQQFQMSIIITSHNMNEVEELCDRVVFINKGKIIADDAPKNLSKTIQTSHIRFIFPKKDLSLFQKLCKKRKLNCIQEGVYTLVDIKETDIPNFLQEITSSKIKFEEISIERPTLEDYFIEMARNK